MIYSEKIKRAMNIAYDAHNGQKDKEGYPYISHPLFVAEKMNTEDATIVALLHDVIEDTDVAFEDIKKEKFGTSVENALIVLTHKKGVSYFDYIREISKDYLATQVKIQDLLHNMDVSRLANVKKEDRERVDKYKTALNILGLKAKSTKDFRKDGDRYFDQYDDVKCHRHSVYDW